MMPALGDVSRPWGDACNAPPGGLPSRYTSIISTIGLWNSLVMRSGRCCPMP
jgi:hypothetical protein